MSRDFEDIKTEIETHLSQSKNTVTIAVGPIFASRWLIPRLNRFRRQHPDIELVLHHGPRLAGSDSLTTDIAVDWGTGDWSGLESTHLLNIRYLPVLSPRLAKDKGKIHKSSDLARFTILHQFDRSEWDAWLQIAGGPKPEFVNETVIVDSNVIVQAAIDGQGIVLGTFPFIQTEVDNGRLICPLDITLEPTRSYHLLTRADARNNSEIMAVCNWLEKESDSSPLRQSEK